MFIVLYLRCLNDSLNDNNIITPEPVNCTIIGEYFKNGNRITVNMLLKPSSVDSNSWEALALNMPKPKISVSVVLTCLDNYDNTTFNGCVVNRNGELLIHNAKVIHPYYINGEYII